MDNVDNPFLHEITPLSNEDCFYVVDRRKAFFSYPIHHHRECELNFVYNASGVKRIVGDSTETIGNMDLVLITGEDLEHVWMQGDCTSQDIREITIQFMPDLLWINKNQFRTIAQMFEKARCGISFPEEAILKVYPLLDHLASEQSSFQMVLNFLELLYELSLFENVNILSSPSYANATVFSTDVRIKEVQEYIGQNYGSEIKLSTLADMAGMTAESFSRFFHRSTSKTLSDYLLDYRVGVAARRLIDTEDLVSTIGYDCGFNNVSYFNRIFKKRKGCTPKDFRDSYKKKKTIV